jgi:AAA ATPase domain
MTQVQTTFSTFAALIVTLGGVSRFLYRRFSKSGSKDIESFSRYLYSGMRYYAAQFLYRQAGSELTLRNYGRQRLLDKRYKEMLVPGSPPVLLDVDTMFVPMMVSDATGKMLDYKRIATKPGERVLLLGDPGCGKSSILKRMFREACRKSALSPRGNAIPVLLELKDVARSLDSKAASGSRLLEAVTEALTSASVFHTEETIQALARGNGLIIFLDGLDEVPTSRSQMFIDALVDLDKILSTRYPRSIMVISSRTQFFALVEQRDLDQAFNVLQVRPFSSTDVIQFLANWDYPADRASNFSRLAMQLRQSESLTQMCTNPLALAMYVARDQQTGYSDPPETRTRFYEALLRELLANRRLRREELGGRQRLAKSRLAMLGSVCLTHLLDGLSIPNSIPKKTLIRAIKAAQPSVDPEAALAYLCVDTGLLAEERTGESYRFLHLTVCEYLAATEVVERGDVAWQRIRDLLFGEDPAWRSRLREVSAFAAGLAPRVLQETILTDLAALGDGDLLIHCSLEAQNYGLQAILASIKNECRELERLSAIEWQSPTVARFRVLLSSLREAAESGNESAATSLPTPKEFILGLVGHAANPQNILTSLTLEDTSAAITLAEQIDTIDALSQVAKAAEDYVALQEILLRADKNEKWFAALIRAALDDRAVAKALWNSRAPESTRQGSESPWLGSYFTRNRAYSYCLGRLACANLDSSHGSLGWLQEVQLPAWRTRDLLAGYHARPSRVVASRLVFFGVSLGVPLVITYASNAVFGRTQSGSTTSPTWVIILSTLAGGLFFGVLVPRLLRDGIRRLRETAGGLSVISSGTGDPLRFEPFPWDRFAAEHPCLPTTILAILNVTSAEEVISLNRTDRWLKGITRRHIHVIQGRSAIRP